MRGSSKVAPAAEGAVVGNAAERSTSPSIVILEAAEETESRARAVLVEKEADAAQSNLERRLEAHRQKHQHLKHISSSWAEIDTDADGRISLDELRGRGPANMDLETSHRFSSQLFDASDLDADGYLSKAEVDRALEGLHADLTALVGQAQQMTPRGTANDPAVASLVSPAAAGSGGGIELVERAAAAATPRGTAADPGVVVAVSTFAGPGARAFCTPEHSTHRESLHAAADGVLGAVAFAHGDQGAAGSVASPNGTKRRHHPMYHWFSGGGGGGASASSRARHRRSMVGSSHRPSQRWADDDDETSERSFSGMDGEDGDANSLSCVRRCMQRQRKRLERKQYEFYRLMQNKTDQVAAVLLIFGVVILGGGFIFFTAATIVNAVPLDDAKWWPRPATCNVANGPCSAYEPEVGVVWTSFSDSFHHLLEAVWDAWLFVADPGTHAEFSRNYVLRAFAMLQSILGIILFTIILALFVEHITRLMNDLREGKSVVVEEHHVLIINWTDKSFTLIEQLCRSMEGDLEEAALHERCRGWCLCGRPARRHCIVLMADRDQTSLAEVTVRYNEARNGAMADREVRDILQPRVCGRRVMPVDIVIRAGNPCVGTDLENFGAAHTAAAIVVLAGSGNADEADAKTLRIVLALKSLPKTRVTGHIVTEVRDIDNSELIQLVGGDSVITLTTHDVLGRLMIKCGRTPELTRVFQAIFGFEGDEFYESCTLKDSEVMNCLIGKRFGDVLHLFTDAIPIGVYDASRTQDDAGGGGKKLAGMRMKRPSTFGASDLRSPSRSRSQIGIEAEQFKIRLKPDDDYVLKADDRIVVLAEDQRWIDTPPSLAPPTLVRGPELVPYTGIAPKKHAEKIMICGWRRDLQDVIDQLDQLVAPGSELHLMCEVPIALRNAKFLAGGLDPASLKNLSIIHWQVNTTVKREWEEDMERRPIEEFDSIMILADEQYEADAMQADSHSVATLMLMRACEDEREERQSSSGRHRRKTLNVVCEILDSRTRDILEQNAQIKGKAEYIHSNVIVSKVMAQIAEEPTIHDIMKQFLDSNGKEIFVRPGSAYCSDAEEKLNFWEMSTRVRKQGDILIGYCRKKVKAVNGAATLSSVLRGALGPHRLSGSRSLFGGMDSVHSGFPEKEEWETEVTINPKGAQKLERMEYSSDNHQIIILSEQRYDDSSAPRQMRSPKKRRDRAAAGQLEKKDFSVGEATGLRTEISHLQVLLKECLAELRSG